MDESLHIWNVATAQSQKKFKGPGSDVVQAIAVSPDGARIAAADSDGTVRIIEAETGTEVHSFRMASRHREKSRSPTVQTDGSWRVRVKTARKLTSGTRKRIVDPPV